jgi:hypothetical protein
MNTSEAPGTPGIHDRIAELDDQHEAIREGREALSALECVLFDLGGRGAEADAYLDELDLRLTVIEDEIEDEIERLEAAA